MEKHHGEQTGRLCDGAAHEERGFLDDGGQYAENGVTNPKDC